MGLDMGLDQAFSQLLRSGVGSGKGAVELESERFLVVRARVWFCVSKAGSEVVLTTAVVSL